MWLVLSHVVCNLKTFAIVVLLFLYSFFLIRYALSIIISSASSLRFSGGRTLTFTSIFIHVSLLHVSTFSLMSINHKWLVQTNPVLQFALSFPYSVPQSFVLPRYSIISLQFFSPALHVFFFIFLNVSFWHLIDSCNPFTSPFSSFSSSWTLSFFDYRFPILFVNIWIMVFSLISISSFSWATIKFVKVAFAFLLLFFVAG